MIKILSFSLYDDISGIEIIINHISWITVLKEKFLRF